MFAKLISFLFKNNTLKQTIAKNTFWLFVGTLFSRLIRVALLIYAARLLGAQEWGAFNYALSIAAFLTIFTDFGVNGVLTRESAHNPHQQEKYFASALLLKGILGVLAIVVLAIIFPLLRSHIISSSEDQLLVGALIPIMIIVVLADSFRDFGAALARAWQKMEIESLVQVSTNVLIAIFGIAALWMLPRASSLAWGYALGTGMGMFLAFVPFRRYFKTIRRHISWKSVREILRASWPFGMMGLMGAIMLNTDSILIGWLKNIEAVGLYGAGQRITQLLYIIPAIIATAFFPAIARAQERTDVASALVSKSILLALFIGIPLGIGGSLLAPGIIQLLYGTGYEQGALPFAFMSLSLIPVFLASPLGNGLFAVKKERQLIAYVLLGIGGNIIFDILLIPSMGIAGAALATLLNQIIIASYLFWRSKATFHQLKIFPGAKNMVVGSIAMGFSVAMLSLIGSPVVLSILIGAAIYGAILIAYKEQTVKDIVTIFFSRPAQTSKR